MDEIDKSGAFKRTASVFRNFVGRSEEFPVEAGRYRLYVSYACPWASRCLFVRAVKGLQDAIPVTVVHPVFARSRPDNPEDQHVGWKFSTAEQDPDFPECTADPIFGAAFLRDIYEQCEDTLGKYTVPILVDTKAKKIVNNESAEIIRMLTKEFSPLATNPELDLYPDDLAPAIDAINEWVYSGFNNGVYRAGFAKAQAPYEEAVRDVFSTLDRLEDILKSSRYLVDSRRITEADVRLFVTLVRFDEVYHGHFKCNIKRLEDYPALSAYTRDLYQFPGVAETVNMKHIKHHYHRSHATINPFGIVPVGPGVDFSRPHHREALSTPSSS